MRKALGLLVFFVAQTIFAQQARMPLVKDPAFKSAIEEGLTLTKRQDFAAAEQAFQKARDVAGADPIAQSYAQFYFGYLEMKRAEAADDRNVKDAAYTKAVSYFQRSVELDPHSPGALFNIGMIRAKQGNFEDATK